MSAKMTDINAAICYACEKDACWKGVPGKTLKGRYPCVKWFFCDDCLIECLADTWAGSGLSGKNFRRIVNLEGDEVIE